MSITADQRPLPLLGRADLCCEPAEYGSEACWIVKDPLSLRYYRLQPVQYRLLKLLDGRRSLTELHADLADQCPEGRLSLGDMRSLLVDLHRKELLVSLRPGQGEVLLGRRRQEDRSRLFTAFRHLLYIRLPGWDPDATLRSLYPLARWMFHPAAAAAACVFVCWSWAILLTSWDQFERQLPSLADVFAWPNLLWIWLAIGGCKLIHELAHGFACRHFGGECHEIGVAFLVLSPCLYCDVSDSWLLPRKRDRILIASAGMLMETVISAAALLLWWSTFPGFVHYLALNVFLVTSMTTVLFNANPLLRYDGYYILSDVMEVPNLRQRAARVLRDTLASTCFGIPISEPGGDASAQRLSLLCYALASTLYRWVLVVSIGLFLFTLLKPLGLQVLAVCYLFVTVCGIAGSVTYSAVRLLRIPRSEPICRTRTVLTCSAVVLCLSAVCFVPLPRSGHAALTIAPAGVTPVHIAEDGRLVELHVQPGDVVTAGQLLAVLENPPLVERAATLELEQARHEVDLVKYERLGHGGHQILSAESLQTVQEQLNLLRGRQRRLEIRAPCSGRVMTGPPRDARATERRLGGWSRFPTDATNLDCLLTRQTEFCRIAPFDVTTPAQTEQRQWRATLLVPQSDCREMTGGSPIEVRLDAFPSDSLRGTIVRIGSRDERTVPPSLSEKFGGTLTTMTTAEGERTTEAFYEVEAAFTADHLPLQSDLRGIGRFSLSSRTLAARVADSLQRTFRFLR